jgi:hypothetical protein
MQEELLAATVPAVPPPISKISTRIADSLQAALMNEKPEKHLHPAARSAIEETRSV